MADGDRNTNGFNVTGPWHIGFSGRGPQALAFLVVLTLVVALGAMVYLMWMHVDMSRHWFTRLEAHDRALDEDIRCLTWVIAPPSVRLHMAPPTCVRGGPVP